MTKPALILTIPALLALAACSGNDSEPSNTAEDFAARINGGTPKTTPAQTQAEVPAPVPMVPGQVAPPQVTVAPGMYVPGTATDPAAETCSANLMGPFLGRLADGLTRSQVQQAAVHASAIRFMDPGSEVIPDPTNPRLNMLLDNTGIIRDAVCG